MAAAHGDAHKITDRKQNARAHAHKTTRRINVRPTPNAVRHVDQLSIIHHDVCGLM